MAEKSMESPEQITGELPSVLQRPPKRDSKPKIPAGIPHGYQPLHGSLDSASPPHVGSAILKIDVACTQMDEAKAKAKHGRLAELIELNNKWSIN